MSSESTNIAKYLNIGKKLPGTISDIDDTEKDNIRAALCNNKGFIDYCDKKIDWTHQEHDYLKNILELPRNEYGYYKDIYGMRVSYNGIRTLKRAKTVLPLSKIHDNEIKKCRGSFVYFREHYCLITTKTGLARPEPRKYQEDLEKELLTLDDVVILYPRQSGKCSVGDTYITIRNKTTGIIEKIRMDDFHNKFNDDNNPKPYINDHSLNIEDINTAVVVISTIKELRNLKKFVRKGKK